VQASSASISSIGQSGFTINWTAGNGDRSLVIARANAPVTAVPVDGVSYTGNAVFGNGTAVAASEFAVFASSGNAVTLSGLAASTTYYVSIYAYNNTGACYLVNNFATVNATTQAATSIIETFEPATKVSYTAANVSCNLGVWNFTDALIGNSAGSDRFNGTRSARLINTGSIAMQFDQTGGIGTVTVNHAVFGSDGSSTWVLEASVNGGTSYDAFVSITYTSSGTALVPSVITLNIQATCAYAFANYRVVATESTLMILLLQALFHPTQLPPALSADRLSAFPILPMEVLMCHLLPRPALTPTMFSLHNFQIHRAILAHPSRLGR
jgi:hypothetical protein